MRNKDLINTSLAWQQVAYMWKNYFTVPSRISPQEVKKYREWLQGINKDKKPLKGLVLGATPELRDALSDFGYLLCSIDINLDMFLAMDELLKNKNSNEVLVKANWLNNPLADKYFDVIVGDAVLPNIPWDERLHLLSEVKRLLKPSGIFLTRAFYVPDKKQYTTMEEIFKHFSKKEEPMMQMAEEVVLEAQILSYDPNDHFGSMTKVKNLMEDFHKRKEDKFTDKKLQEIHDIVWEIWCQKFVGKDWVYAYRREEEDEYRRFFKTTEVFEAKDHDYTKITPMYFLSNT